MQPLIYQNQPVLTSAMLAEKLGVSTVIIKDNFYNNKDKHIDAKHFFLLEGETLRTFKSENGSKFSAPLKGRQLYLWTEKGCLLHVKSVGTDEAWDVFNTLVDGYFRQQQALEAIKQAHAPKPKLIEHTQRPVQIENSKQVNAYNWHIGGLTTIEEYNRLSCKLHSGKFPSELKAEYLKPINEEKRRLGKKEIKITSVPSGKEILRKIDPASAAAMSLTDDMVKMGGNLEEIAPLSVNCKPLFEKMLQLGYSL